MTTIPRTASALIESTTLAPIIENRTINEHPIKAAFLGTIPLWRYFTLAIAAAAAAPAEAPQSGSNKAAPKEDDNLITIKSPMIGTFYRSAGPDKDPFMNVGSTFTVGDKLCIIEAMKTFNEIEAEVSGKIVKVLVDDASPVDYEQPLFLVEPA